MSVRLRTGVTELQTVKLEASGLALWFQGKEEEGEAPIMWPTQSYGHWESIPCLNAETAATSDILGGNPRICM